ncbi:MAG: ATP-binding protein, partial [Actinobacteria bacterium]|nr:ATP-binding protein [Actinomycetota bacterium]
VNVGVPKFTVVGLPAKSICESEQRIRSALEASAERWPPSRKVINLAPAGLPKDGTHFDLPMTLGLIAGDKRLDPNVLCDWVLLGELALDGSIRPVRGVLPAALACKKAGRRGIVCPAENAGEAVMVEDIEVIPVSSLRECVGFLKGTWSPPEVPPAPQSPVEGCVDMSEVRGQDAAKAALEIAAAGGHNVLL